MHDLISNFIEFSAVAGINQKSFSACVQQTKYKEGFDPVFCDLYNFLSFLCSYINDCSVSKTDLTQKSISQRLKLLIWNRLMFYPSFKNFRDFLKAEIYFSLKPTNMLFASKQIWSISDCFWRAVGDSSADFSFYTKRAILSKLYSASLARFISDFSCDFKDTEVFLDKKIQLILRFTKFKMRVKSLKDKIF